MTRGSLLGTTALAVVLAPCAAVASERISLELGGYFHGFFVAGRQDDGPGEAGFGVREHGVAREGEIHFTGSTTLENGLQVGVRVELEAETSADQIDESYVWLEGRFGRIEIGSEDGAAEQMFYGPPVPIPNHGVNSPTQFHASIGANAVGISITYVTISFDRDKVVYFTPRVRGFQFGISYTPDFTEELGGGFRPDVTPMQQSEIVETAVNWIGAVGGADIGLYAGYATADLEVAAPGLEDQDMWGFGGAIEYGGFLVGGSYRWTDNGTSGPNTDRRDWNLGVAYTRRAWILAAAYGHGEVEAGAAGGEDTLDHFEVGVIYTLGPGIALTGGVQYVEFEDNLGAAAAENKAVIGILGTRITF